MNEMIAAKTGNDTAVALDKLRNISRFLINWITPLLNLGYARPLETTDLWKLDEWRASEVYADRIISSFDRRHAAAQEYNARLAKGKIKPSLSKRIVWTLKGGRVEREKQWREKDGLRKASLIFAMNDAIKWFFWPGGMLHGSSSPSCMSYAY